MSCVKAKLIETLKSSSNVIEKNIMNYRNDRETNLEQINLLLQRLEKARELDIDYCEKIDTEELNLIETKECIYALENIEPHNSDDNKSTTSSNKSTTSSTTSKGPFDPNGKFPCLECSTNFSSKQRLMSHNESKHK